MNRWLRGALALGLGFGLTLTAIKIEESGSHHAQPAGTALGPIDMDNYCHHEYGDRARLIHPSTGAYGWICWVLVDGLLNSYGIDADKACALDYGTPAYGEAIKIDDPYGWVCRRGPCPGS